MLFCFVAEMLFQDASTYNYLSNGMLPVSGVDDASDLQDSLVSQSYGREVVVILQRGSLRVGITAWIYVRSLNF